MSAQSEFTADPVGFMENHVVVCNFPMPWEPGGINQRESRPHVITIEEIAESTVVNLKNAKAFQFTANTTGRSLADKLVIYWLGFQPKVATGGTVDGRSNYVFTAVMSGCTLGIGSQTGDGSCTLYHANAIGSEPPKQRADQRVQLDTAFNGADYSRVSPLDYRSDRGGSLDYLATNFGVRDGGRWNFYTHKYLKMNHANRGEYYGGKFIHGGIEEARTISTMIGYRGRS
ncbi:MAG: hypothetical protein N2C14_17440 [Planctomycetales bacterium]